VLRSRTIIGCCWHKWGCEREEICETCGTTQQVHFVLSKGWTGIANGLSVEAHRTRICGEPRIRASDHAQPGLDHGPR